MTGRSTPRSVLCVSAGLLRPKKDDNPLARLHLYLNYGLLSLATVLARNGHHVRVVHGNFTSPMDFVASLRGRGLLGMNTPILLSVPSSFALPWARAFTREIRSLQPSTRIVVGGRWVVADDHNWIAAQLPDADEYVAGLAEEKIAGIVAGERTAKGLRKRPEIAPLQLPTLDYSLLEEFRGFNPSIEVSRGCGRGCSFCAEATAPLSELKRPSLLAEELSSLIDMYGGDAIHPYFEASFFRPSTDWIANLRREFALRGVRCQWRAETRADAVTPTQVEALAGVGLRVLDIGLESASPTQLRSMKKTTHPEVYLRRASDMLKACASHNVLTKVNVLLHPGETLETIAETSEWLEMHSDMITGVSVGPTILFRYGQASKVLLEEFKALGADPVEEDALDRDGYAHLHLSSAISYDHAHDLALTLSRRFMSARDYFELKSFSYLPRSFRWEDFARVVTSESSHQYPFSDTGLA